MDSSDSGSARLALEVCTLDLARREVHRDGDRLPLSELEVRLLERLLRHPGRPVSRNTLLKEVWGYPKPVRTRSVDNTVMRLRAKIERDPSAPTHLISTRGVGYHLELPKTAGPPTAGGAPFLGRARDLAALERLVADGARAVCLLGPGGVGKTRLAQEWCAAQGAVVWCDLSEARTPEDVARAVATALNVPLAVSGDAAAAVARIGRALAARGPQRVVLDNLEQLAGVVEAPLGAWLAAAPGLTLLLTSRQRVRRPEVAHLELEPLAPTAGVSLLRALSPRELPPDAPGLAALVRRLDGLPLALELAAPRLALMSPAALLDRLDGRPGILRDEGSRPARHATLQAALGWSWDLLDPDARGALEVLSLFAGPFSLEDAEAVLDPEGTLVMDRLGALRAASLLVGEAAPGAEAPSFRLLESVRAFARSRLDAGPGRDAGRLRFARWVLSEALRWGSALHGGDGARCERRLTERVPDAARAARLVEPLDPALAAELVVALRAPLLLQGPLDEGLLALAERAAANAGDPELQARVAILRGACLQLAGQLPRAVAALESAAQAGVALAEWVVEAEARIRLGHALAVSGALEAAAREGLEGRRIARAVGHHLLTSMAEVRLGFLRHLQGDIDGARGHLRAALALQQAREDRAAVARTLGNLALFDLEEGNTARARAALEEALRLDEALGNRAATVRLRIDLAGTALETGALNDAAAHLERAGALARRFGDAEGEAMAALDLGHLAQLRGQPGEALTWLTRARLAFTDARNALFIGLTWIELVALEASTGNVLGAEQALAEAEALLEGVGSPVFLDGLEVARAHLALALARQAPDPTPMRRQAAAQVAPVRERAARSSYLRGALALFDAVWA
ncbi:MAG: winged helix-turn-helix domain-containing protein [Alphaproteobacteria bacterium]|nr:winged helix-turn-helix domain-containing protein [Alphaproteobacteria bacterium]